MVYSGGIGAGGIGQAWHLAQPEAQTEQTQGGGGGCGQRRPAKL